MEDQDYAAEKIIKKQVRKGKVRYLIKWKDSCQKRNTWESEENIFDARLIEIFEQTQKNQNNQTLLESVEPVRSDIEEKTPNTSQTSEKTANNEATKFTNKEPTTKDDRDSSSSSKYSVPLAMRLARRKKSSGTGRKAKVYSKSFPRESGKIDGKITTSPPSGSCKTPESSSSTGKNTTKSLRNEKKVGKMEDVELNEISDDIPFAMQLAMLLVPPCCSYITPEEADTRTKNNVKKQDTKKLSKTSSENTSDKSTTNKASEETRKNSSSDSKTVEKLPKASDKSDSSDEAITKDEPQDKVDSQKKKDSNKRPPMLTKTVLIDPGYEYWRLKNPVADKIVITDVEVGKHMVTIRECSVKEGFFKERPSQ